MKNKRILIVSQVFWPENFKINDLCSDLIKKGYDITILTGKPNYPKGEFYDGYSFFSKNNDLFKGAKIIRVPIITRGNGSGIRLSLNYLSFAFFGSLFALFHWRRYDFSLVFGVSPITAAIPAIIHRIIYKTKMALWVQDLWPESVDVTGKLKSSFLRNLLVLLVKFIYQQSDKIFVSSEFMKKSIIEKLGSKHNKNIYYLPNWAEDTYLGENVDTNKYLSLMPEGFKIMVAGNISFGQDFPSIIKAALILKKTSNVKFVILGDGSEKNYLIDQIRELKLNDTIYYLGSFPLEEMTNLYYHADMMLLTLRDEPIYSYTVPCKLQGYLASKKPVAGMINGEAAEIIKKSKCGFVVNAEDYKALAAELLSISKMPVSFLEEAKHKGFTYYEKTFKKEAVISSFLESTRTLK